MNKLVLAALFCAAAALPLSILADTNAASASAESVISEALAVIQSEGWSASDVADAIRSLRGLYLRDNATKEGRKRWHGKIISTSVDTNAMTQTTVYESGEVFVDPAKVVTPAASNARLKTVMTNGVPAALAAARTRRAAEVTQGVSNVTQTVTAGTK